MLLAHQNIEVNREADGKNALSCVFQLANKGFDSIVSSDQYEMAVLLSAHGATRPTATHTDRKLKKQCDWAVAAGEVAVHRFEKWRSTWKLPKTLTDSFTKDRKLPDEMVDLITRFAPPSMLGIFEAMRRRTWWRILLLSCGPMARTPGIDLADWLEGKLAAKRRKSKATPHK